MRHKPTRQEADDFSAMNPVTGLPKHVYFYTHADCTRTAIRGTFQMKKKKYHTRTVRYGEGIRTLDEACLLVLDELKKMKAETGYDQYIKEGQHRKRVKQVYQHESLYPKDQ